MKCGLQSNSHGSLALARVEQGAKDVLVAVLGETHPSGFFMCEDVASEEQYIVYFQNLMPLPNDTIPYRFSKENFDRVASYIGDALRVYPDIIKVESTLAATTLARLIQEAIRAKQKYHHKHSTINEKLFDLHGSAIGTSVQGEHLLLVGDREMLRRRSSTLPPPAPTQPEFEIDRSKVAAVLGLLAAQTFKPPPHFFVTGITPAEIEDAEKHFDVVFTQDEVNPNKYYIV